VLTAIAREASVCNGHFSYVSTSGSKTGVTVSMSPRRVWQLDQFPFREDSVDAARTAIGTLKRLHRALDRLDTAALAEAQERQDAMAAQRLVQDARFGPVPE